MRGTRAAGGTGLSEAGFRLVRVVVVAAFGVLVAASSAQVIARYVIRYPLGWTDELSRIMLIWFVFVSVPALVYRRRLLRIDAFVDYLPARPRALVSAAVNLLSAGFVGWLCTLTVQLIGATSGQRSTALEIPYWIIYVSMPVGLGIAVLYLLRNAVLDLGAARRPDGRRAEAPEVEPERF